MRTRTGERGAALLVVMVAVAVLTVLATDLAYETQVALRIAGNARDELQASYLAKSGLALSRLVLSMQQDVDLALPVIPNAPLPRPQVWRLVPVGSALAASLFGDGAGGAAPAGGLFAAAHGSPEGTAPGGLAAGGFDATLDDEGRKVNVQFDSSSALLSAQVQALYQLICDARWDPLFDREDENGLRVSRQDLLVYLHDWVDLDSQSSVLAASFPATCTMLVPGSPFEDGYQDENYPYDRGDDPYKAKNARLDSLEELSMVAGVTDAFLAAFRDKITVYLPRDAKRTLSETDPDRLVDLARVIADPPDNPVLGDPKFKETLHKLVLQKTLGGILSMSAWDFGQIVQFAGVSVNTNRLTAGSSLNPFTNDSPSTFRILARGRAGEVVRTIDAIVRVDKPSQGQVVSIPGRLVHWREE